MSTNDRRTPYILYSPKISSSSRPCGASAGEWELLTAHGVKTSRVAPDGPDLDGLQIGKSYRFKCAEVTEQVPLWRDRKTLYPQSIGTA